MITVHCPVWTLARVMSLFQGKVFSDRGTNERQREEETFVMFRDLLDEYESQFCLRICSTLLFVTHHTVICYILSTAY